jgi:hypothetical protein
MVSAWVPEAGDYVIATDPYFGDRAWIVSRRAVNETGQRGIVAGGKFYPLACCRSLHWQPMPGMEVQIVTPSPNRVGETGIITRLHELQGMPLADLRLESGRMAEVLFDWIEPTALDPSLVMAHLEDLAMASTWSQVEKVLTGLFASQRKQIWAACPATLRQSLWGMRRKEAPQVEQNIGTAN